MDEQYYENLLNIKTSGKQDLNETSIHYNRYEPTDYSSLEKFFSEYSLKETDSIIDFGSGKGRLNFFINNKFNAKVTGIEMNTFFYNEALKNKSSYIECSKKDENKISFINCLAEEYSIKDEDNIFYFFNPFSLQIFIKVLENILISFCKCSRQIDIILFYPSTDYIFFLENSTLFNLVLELKLDNFKNDPNERFLVYRLSPFK